MNKPVVACCWFDRHTGITKYSKYAKVWNYSADRVFENSVEKIMLDVPPPDFKKPCPVFHRGSRYIGPSKTHSWMKKIDLWKQIVAGIDIGIPILMIDVDVMFFHNPFPMLKQYDFDVAYCGNNTGAVYFSGSKESHEFMEEWYSATKMLFNNKELYKYFDLRYKGLDQASMGYLKESGYNGKNVIELSRRFHSTCSDFEIPAFIMHYHSRLQSTIFGDKKTDILHPDLRQYHGYWKNALKNAIKEGY